MCCALHQSSVVQGCDLATASSMTCFTLVKRCDQCSALFSWTNRNTRTKAWSSIRRPTGVVSPRPRLCARRARRNAANCGATNCCSWITWQTCKNKQVDPQALTMTSPDTNSDESRIRFRRALTPREATWILTKYRDFLDSVLDQNPGVTKWPDTQNQEAQDEGPKPLPKVSQVERQAPWPSSLVPHFNFFHV